ncbi:cytochrome P450 89A9-like [Nicotiana tabacum]|uniref:Cytochrome P450 89A2-like n=1 Tax=Nicotiana tabacum TaxID=4097 RepID=A0A1S4DK04_TOBAC|nr:PREDICTED: cytochrome P450 89A2-like [Nicotiana tabacum]
MELWLMIIITLCISFFLKSIFNLLIFLKSKQKNKKLPPGPFPFSAIVWFNADIQLILRSLTTKYGPLINLRIGSLRPSIFVASHSLAYQALVQHGAVFSDRPKDMQTVNSQRINISFSPYGPLWRLLRRNLTSEIVQPSRVKSYSNARSWALSILIQRLLHVQSDSGEVARLIDHFQHSMFCLLLLMCFGEKIEGVRAKQIEDTQRSWLLSNSRFKKLIKFFPGGLGKIILRNRWEDLVQLQQEQEGIFIPLIQARMKAKSAEKTSDGSNQETEDEAKVAPVACYVDTLLNLELPEEKKKLNLGQIISLCSEFLNAATDTTSTSLQWIMANLVKYPPIQEKLYQEICEVVNTGNPNEGKTNRVKEEDVQKMPYLKAVILEGLRRHPPVHLLLPHAVTEEVELNGYVIPKDSTINFMVAEMGLDPEVWENPLDFKPDRFLDHDTAEAFDIIGSREIKMMPFGAGRRVCPGYGLAMIHLEYFVANLIWHFEWKAVDGDDVDLSELQELTVVMKNPLRARVLPRVNQ